MQVPRGTFLSIQKNTRFITILEDLKNTHFNGYCLVNQGKHTYSLVVRQGKTVLASVHQKHGDEAISEIQSILDEPVDAILSELTPVQIQLAIEFNIYAQVTQPVLPVLKKKRGTSHSPSILPPKPDTPANPKNSRTPLPGPRVQESRELRSPSLFKIISEVTAQQGGESAAETDSAVMIDLDCLDSMDLNRMVEKIRSSARDTVQNLELGHLLEKGERDA